MRTISGIYNTSTGEWQSRSNTVIQSWDGSLSIEVCGTLRPMDGDDNFAALFRRHGAAVTGHLTGNYLAGIYDGDAKALTIIQDRMTSPITMYYSQCGDLLHYSTSLKQLLMQTSMARELEEKSVEEFLVNGYLYGERTLLKNVFKLKAFHALVADGNGVRQVHVDYPLRKLTMGEALDLWKPTLDTAIRDTFRGETEINQPISSGYDSNYILHVATKFGELPVNAFSIGGKKGKNELPKVKENMKEYPDVKLHTALTSDDTLQHFPDIVWRLEGNVYEAGVFLQYELAKLVTGLGKKYLVCGECADQVMNENFLKQDRIFPDKFAYYPFDKFPYIYSSHLILKKNGILFNSFGVETKYPYYDERFVSVANAVAPISGRDKRCHVANCKSCLPPTVLKNSIVKIGGNTEFHSLFANADECGKLLATVENSDFHRKFSDVIFKNSYEAVVAQAGGATFKSKLRRKVLDMLGIGRKQRRKDDYYREEMRLRDALCASYLMIFERLFVKDANVQFDAESCDKPFDRIL